MKRSSSNRNITSLVLILLGSILILGAVLVGIKLWLDPEPGLGKASERTQQGTQFAKGAKAINFELLALGGESIRLEDYSGTPILINFWASWCGPCREEMPLIQRYYQENNNDLMVLGINFDEKAPIVQEFVNELGLTFPILLDPGGNLSSLYQVRGYPTSVFIDRDGNIQVIHIGSFQEDLLIEYLNDIGLEL